MIEALASPSSRRSAHGKAEVELSAPSGGARAADPAPETNVADPHAVASLCEECQTSRTMMKRALFLVAGGLGTLLGVATGCSDEVGQAMEAAPTTPSGSDGDAGDGTNPGQAETADASLANGGDGGDGGASSVTDASTPPSYSRCPLQGHTTLADAGAVWSQDFSTGTVTDPSYDDTGSGSYLYPSYVLGDAGGGSAAAAGFADITSFRMAYAASSQELSFAVSVRELSEHTRLGLLLIDDAHFPKTNASPLSESELEWTITGNELRVPNWTNGGVSFLLAKPGTKTFDLALRNNLAAFGSEYRPDNALYVRRNGWLDCKGAFTSPENRVNVMQLDVDATGNTLSFKVPASVLQGHVDLRTPRLHAILYAYLLAADRPRSDVEFGAVEITEALGGLANAAEESWREPDVYDVAFVTEGSQAALLTPPPVPDGGFTGNDESKLVTLKRVGHGVLTIDTTVVR